MLSFIIILVIAWLLGVFGWSQVIGSIRTKQNGFVVTIIIWLAILGVGAYFAITKFGGIVPMVIGYVISIIVVLGQKNIE